MNINIFGSTGSIGSNSLKLLSKFFPEIKINLLVVNKNYKKLIKQVYQYKPNFIFINDNSKIDYIKKNINKKTKILQKKEINQYLQNSKTDLTLLAISGYESLNYFESIIKNTKNLGLVNKECVVSAGHLFKNILKKNNIKLFPLDSEHFSLSTYFNNDLNINYNKIFLTASGGPFLNNKFEDIKNVSFNQAKKHPKWKMGYKNSIDSSTLSNKCLELIEAHYLFNIPFEKLDAIIHPEALIHSIVQLNNHTSNLNFFYHTMDIPLFNFFNLNNNDINFSKLIKNKNYDFSKYTTFNFKEINLNLFPIYNLFLKMNKNDPKDFIKFNLGNQFAVELFKNKKINYGDIYKIVAESVSIDTNNSINSLENIIKYHFDFNRLLTIKYETL